MSSIALDVSGMSCAACSARIEKVLSRVDGVSDAQVNLALERANIEIDGETTPAELIRAIEKAGYGARIRTSDTASQGKADETREAARRAEERQTLCRFALSAVLSAVLIAGTFPAMAGFGSDWIGPWMQAALAGGVLVISGSRFYREAFAAVRGGGANMAVLVSLGMSVAFFYSLCLVFAGKGAGHLYFDAAATVPTLVMLGKYIEARAKQGASAAVTALARHRPRTAELLTGDGATRPVAAEELRPGDLIRVRPGTSVPCDGIIVSGRTSIDESLITGESLPADRAEGAKVITGTINQEAAIEVRVEAVGADTALAGMIRLIEQAQRGDAPVQRLVDRISAVFVPVILIAALVTFLGWWLLAGEAAAGLGAAVAVLVIACPCALGLATPTALVAGTGAAAKAGILIRDIEALDQAEAIRGIAFDKTGTLTLGQPVIVAVLEAGMPEKELLAVAAALEAQSEHALAKALAGVLAAGGIETLQAGSVRALSGRGITGTVAGRTVALGNRELALEQGIAEDAIDALSSRFGEAGTSAFVIVDGALSGAILFADEPRREAASVIAEIKRRGLTVLMLTGDSEEAARSVAEKIGLDDVRARLRPEDKVNAIRALASKCDGDVAFVGDGLNDGPALAAAGLGIALSSGTDIAREAAAVTLMRPDLRLVPAALDIAHLTKRTITRNLAWAFVYNVIGIPLAALGVLSPVIAGAAMAFSSVSVVANSALLARWTPVLLPRDDDAG